MKSMKKVLASVLALAMVVTAVPVTNANAASAPKLNKTKASVYATKSTTLKVTTPSTWKSVKVTASSSKKTVATVKVSKKTITVKGVKAGTAKVTVKVTGKVNKKAASKTLKATITVKPVAIAAVEAEKTVAVGETAKDLFTVKPAGKKLAYKTSDASIATVDANGVVTAVKAGEATITASSKYAKEAATVKVTVKNYVLQNVAQNKTNELVATVTGDTSKVKTTDIKIVNTDTKVVYPVQKVTVDSKDKTKVTLALFSDLKDGKEYEVTLDGVTKSFKASDGKVASIALDTVTVPFATETEIKLIAKDAQGVIVKELNYEAAVSDSNYDFTINTNGNGYMNGSKLYLNKVGDTAVAEITYKTGKYDQNGKPEGNIGPDKVTITATAQSEVNSFDVRIDEAGKNYDKAKDNKQIAVNEAKKNIAYFMIKNADGKEISNYGAYTVESSDNSVLMLAGKNFTSKTVSLTPVKAGAAYILIKDKDGNIVNSVMINVVAERAVATMELDSYSIAISKNIKETKTVKATLKDQYGDEVPDTVATVVAECLSTDVSGAKPSDYAANVAGQKVTFDANVLAKGNYVFKISYKNKDGKEIVAKTVSVVVKETSATDATAWRLSLDKTNVDINVNNDNKDSQTITAKVVGMADGVDINTVTDVNYTVKKLDGTVVYGGTSAVTGAAFNVTSGGVLTITPVKVDKSAGTATVQLDAGTYSLEVEYEAGTSVKKKTSTNFTVTDKQAKASVEVKKNDGLTTGKVEDVLGQALVVTYGEKTYTNITGVVDGQKPLNIVSAKVKTNKGVEVATGSDLAADTTFTVTEVKVSVEVADGINMTVSVNVPGAFTVK